MPYSVLSAGEDGQVLSIDIREPKSDKILLLRNEKDKKVPIYSIHTSLTNSTLFCTSGRDQAPMVVEGGGPPWPGSGRVSGGDRPGGAWKGWTFGDWHYYTLHKCTLHTAHCTLHTAVHTHNIVLTRTWDFLIIPSWSPRKVAHQE